MKYSKIVALVPGTEHFDEAVVNEGVWLTASHLNNIEAALTTSADADAEIETMRGKIDGLVDTAVNAASTIKTQSARIVELDNEVAVLSAKPSGNGSKLFSTKDEVAGDAPVIPSYLDENDPINQFADSKMRKKKS